jgi:hypothetical protein
MYIALSFFMSMMHIRSIAFISMIMLTASCSYFIKSNTKPDADVIARVKDDYLYASDLASATRGLHGKDSIDAIKSFAESWVRKKLLLQKAQENILEDDVGIAKKVEDYREALVLYEYEKELIEQKLDTTIRPAELNTWYEKTKNDFPAEEDFFRVFYIKLPKDAPDLKEARKWIMKPKDEEEQRKLEGYCRDIALSYSIDNGRWYTREMIKSNFPFPEGELNGLAASKNYKEFKADDIIWFVKVAEKVSKDEASPLELVSGRIAGMVIEKRKLQLLEKTYSKIYEDGRQSESFNIYLK